MFQTFPHYLLKSVPGTNTLASQWIQQGKTDFVLQTLSQTAGRGRQGRPWHQDNGGGGNLFLTVGFAVGGDLMQALSFHPFFWPIVLHDVIADVIGHDMGGNLTLKWPNDILLMGKKISGILIETAYYQGKPHLIVGMGINLNNVPDTMKDGGMCLKDITEQDLNLFSMARLILKTAGGYLNQFENAPQALYQAWQGRCLFVGKPVKVRQNETFIHGIMQGLSPEGYLQLFSPQTGQVHAFHTIDEILVS